MKGRTRIAIIVAAIVFGTAILRVAGALQPVEDLLRTVTLPIGRVFASLGTGVRDAVWTAPDVAHLEERNTELEARLTALAVDYVRLRSLEEENRSLRALTGFLDRSGYDSVPARIIARSADPRDATILIDRGSRDGVETGMAVVADEGVFVGKVTSLKERIATVTLVSDVRSRVAAASPGRGSLFGLVEGSGNRVARLTLVPQQVALASDDVVVTAGTEEKIPPNLLIGLVNDVEGKPTDPFKSASLEPLANIDRIDLVIVLRPEALRPSEEGGAP
ncbi:rod shape-determining protein MreC [Patescibacteria group bacterium]|nr:rod shape-determining protein MreC [Patescibacteria group bacterium]MBU1448910.1 rod shape-determining protein MreC [Patescibacteria group bacterium]MBU2612924.1 rod shape-determining protein MreC [Patescibacteria group bacterium]